jgi:hypothetical protein
MDIINKLVEWHDGLIEPFGRWGHFVEGFVLALLLVWWF